MTPSLPQLPIDSILDSVLAEASRHSCLVIEAPPGAGKTTRVPPALLRMTRPGKQIWVAEPRRLAAKLMAHRVASELGQPPGELVGYTVRFEDCAGPATRLRYVTSGILLRRLLTDPNLSDVDCVVLDEFHERHSDTDLALAMLRRVQMRRPELRLVVMSATLDGARIAEFLGGCPRLTSEGRLFPLAIEFEAASDDRPLEKRVASALRKILAADPSASTLVFLPGAAEIRRTQAVLADLCAQLHIDIHTLHGDLSLDAQSKAILPGARARVVLSTNIAESSITVAGITAVIDSGLSRQLDTSSASGLSRLSVQKISRASAIQRAGRAGRTAQGRVIRLFTKGDFESRPEFDSPEIVRVDFAESLLLLCGAARRSRAVHGAGATRGEPSEVVTDTSDHHRKTLDWLLLDSPPPTSIESARSLLRQLGALEVPDQLTPIGEQMLDIPLHPRLARLLIECETREIGQLGALVAALLSERDLRGTRTSATRTARQVFSGDSDVVDQVERFMEARDMRMSAAQLRAAGLDVNAFYAVQRTYEQLRRFVRSDRRSIDLDDTTEAKLAIALLVAFPDRIARRRSPGVRDLVLRSGATARLDDASVVTKASFMLAIDADVRRETGRSFTIVRVASAIDESWLIDVLPEELASEEEYEWLEPPGRVEVRSRIRIGSIVVDESRRAASPGVRAAEVLMARADAMGLLQADEVCRLFARIELVAPLISDESGDFDAPSFRTEALNEIFRTRVDFEDLDGKALADALQSGLPPKVVARLHTDAPEYVLLPRGRRCTVQYQIGKSPFIASRLQDFFGQVETPSILGGRKKLVVHLLAPNQRAVQITDDLRGFWKVHYPELRRQLMRRYPKHAWPEDGQSATPPDPRPSRR